MIENKAKFHIGFRKLSAMRFAWKAWLLCLLLAPAAYGKSVYPPDLPGARNETYKTVDGVPLKVWIFTPKNHQATNRLAAIVFFFGGGWSSGSPAQFEQQCRHLAERGMVAITVDYRVKSRQNVKPVKCVADARSAMRWVRVNAAKLGVDPQRMAAGGGSAGGHLAAATAFIKDFDEPGEDTSVSAVPNALVLFNPALMLAPLDGYTFDGKGERVSEERFGTTPEKISPVHHVYKGAPPTIIFHGKSDTTVPYVTAEAFTAEMKKAGNSCKLVGYEGAGHGFFNKDTYYDLTLAETDKFLTGLGWLTKKAE